ncbi:hypothetical protein FH063_005161 [Azospirillum argentinense]|uniref:Uncharacterized protein n=1 Tax=Azospirillum argentinense TaxID=2970906 RepID=A0A5B0KV01_9PROT|nr:hypothetical protein FH063_005161 [Azospirillum argentinense]
MRSARPARPFSLPVRSACCRPTYRFPGGAGRGSPRGLLPFSGNRCNFTCATGSLSLWNEFRPFATIGPRRVV